MSKEQMNEVLAAEAGVTTGEVANAAATNQDDALASMLAAAEKNGKAAKEASGVKAPKAKKEGAAPARRRSEEGTRAVHVIKSAAANEAVLITNIKFNTMTPERAIAAYCKDKAKSKNTAVLIAQDDLVFETIEVDIPVAELDQAKLTAYEALEVEGFKVLGNKPKIKETEAAAPAPEAEVASEEPAAEEAGEAAAE